MSLLQHPEVERARAARRLRALAELLMLRDGTVAGAVGELLDASCERSLTPDRDTEAMRAVSAWVEGGEQPSRAEELHRLFGDGFCECSLPTVPACASYYVADSSAVRERLQRLYERCGYKPPGYTTQCAGTGYVSQQLGFLAHCIERAEADPGSAAEAMPVLRESLLEWLPLFSRALVSSSRHPAVVFAGLSLECLLASDPVISQVLAEGA